MPLLTKWKTTSDFQPILDKVQNQVRVWQSKLISQAGRLTLIKSVLSLLTYCPMQTTILPSGITTKIDQVICGFLLGNTSEQRHLHIVGWDTLTQSKMHGGLGIRKTKENDEAFLMNQAWWIWSNLSSLLAKFINHKYCHTFSFLQTHFVIGSHAWRAILRGRNLLQNC